MDAISSRLNATEKDIQCSAPSLSNQRPIELLKTCIVLFMCESPTHNLFFPLTLISFTEKLNNFIHRIAKQQPYLFHSLRLAPILNHQQIDCHDQHLHATTNSNDNQHSTLSLCKLIDSSSFDQLLFTVKQILIDLASLHMHNEKLLHLSQCTDTNSLYFDLQPHADKTVILFCNVSLLKLHFASLLDTIQNHKKQYLQKHNQLQSKAHHIPKKRVWHETHDEDLLFSSNFVFPLAKRQRTDIDDSEHNKKILQRLPMSAASNPNKTIKDIQEEISDLLDYKSCEEMSSLQVSSEVINMLRTPSTKQILINNLYSTRLCLAVNEFCQHGTKHQCKISQRQQNPSLSLLSLRECGKIHFIRIMRPHTNPALGDCSYLDGCRHMDTCRFIHYVIDEECVAKKKPYFKARRYLSKLLLPNKVAAAASSNALQANTGAGNVGSMAGGGVVSGGNGGAADNGNKNEDAKKVEEEENESESAIDTTILRQQIYQNQAIHRFKAQWVNCDARALDFNVLGKFGVIMADPPWDIHMELPYGTLTDEEMLDLNVGQLADDNCLLFLWVTGRVMETARKCMKRWGFECEEEVLWIKTNQLQRIIRTGRTGHWLNHSKEHCLVGVKGNDVRWNRCLDCDIIVAEVRETSRKPDEIYNLIERLSPGTKKIEIFGRPHNTRPGWMTLGNQLNGTRILNPSILKRFKALYPTIHVKTTVEADDEDGEENEEDAVEEEPEQQQEELEDASSSNESTESDTESGSATESDSGSSRSESDTESESRSSRTDSERTESDSSSGSSATHSGSESDTTQRSSRKRKRRK